MTAEEFAARFRQARDDLVAAIANGQLAIDAVGNDRRSGPVKVVALAQVVPGIGKVRGRRILEALGIAESTRWGELSAAQHEQLVLALTDPPPD